MTDVFNGVFVSSDTPTIVQGLTGRAGRRHATAMRAYGTRIVAGVSPRDEGAVDGIPVFRTCAQAVGFFGPVETSVIIVPPLSVLPAMLEALAAGIRLLVTITEGMPAHDAAKARAAVRAVDAKWVGASTPGLAIPGKLKLGFLPTVSLAPGDLGVMAKSGTLSYEVCYRLVTRGMGQSLWVGVGGDPIKGMRFADILPYFNADSACRAIVVIGEIGGDEEEELALAMEAAPACKPVFALIAGQNAREGVTMGHAGALIHGSAGAAAGKAEALRRAGAFVFSRIEDLVDTVCAHGRARAM